MKLAGKIPKSARDVAEDLRVKTLWEKYRAYDVIIELGVHYQDIKFNTLEWEPREADSHKINKMFMNRPDVQRFCEKCKVKKQAEFFRYAMFQGANVFVAFRDNTLPAGETQEKVYGTIEKIVGKNEKLTHGLERLKELVAQDKKPDTSGADGQQSDAGADTAKPEEPGSGGGAGSPETGDDGGESKPPSA